MTDYMEDLRYILKKICSGSRMYSTKTVRLITDAIRKENGS